MAFKTSSSPKTLVILLVVSTVTVVGILRHRQNIKQNFFIRKHRDEAVVLISGEDVDAFDVCIDWT